MADDGQESKGSSGKGLMIVLIALVVILIFAIIGGGYFLYSHGALGNNNSASHEEVKKEDSSDKPDAFKADITDLVLNLIDVVISQISSRSSEELLTVGGKNLLKDELLQDINNVINEVTKGKPEVAKNSVKQILFTTFVIK